MFGDSGFRAAGAAGRFLQRHLAYTKTPTPQNHHWALGIRLLEVPRGWRFLMSEVPL